MNTVKIKRLNKLAKIPTRGTAESAGYDLYAATENLPGMTYMLQQTKIFRSHRTQM